MENQVKIKRHITDHAAENQFTNFTHQILSMTSKLVIEPEKGEKRQPGFLLRENITYSALPLEKELEPFLEALSQINGIQPAFSERALSESIRQALDKIDIPVRLKLYIALSCPHCPTVVRTIIPLALYCSNIHLDIIDGSLFPGAAQKDRVMSAPCLILDDNFRWTGSVAAQEIIEMIARRDPSQLSTRTLKTILENGEAAWITRQMIKKGKIFEAFIKLLLHETWSVRLGAMVVVEELAEIDPDLAVSLCPILIELFDQKEIPVQGDILYALGEAGNMETREWIQVKLPEFEHPDLIEAAADAIDSLKETI